MLGPGQYKESLLAFERLKNPKSHYKA